ncbi:AzlD domain-containing protein [Pseudochrobactrum algeriensis]|uniref:AzlD domain-containing protein n=1 Tax=Pseudochrobactrum algeriensis TaxID=2834768 RepID=UPI001BCBCFED|nr:AzlD domain-containing protein [Pseudochrobactrum algeriensis]MBX8811459.1 AzlD domain-containing protein [Ochrobactrum sp. MR34]QVQ37961.1 AzlD domain-containing protein [Pseudochrobactrum algeriensis]QVQ41183.1 AzlD domain-containing protein [Pseudochrobactrum algeriensis]QVQ45107.1 AzlD domain-containing protein [Pseudochrobactrum algeriensis]
MNFTSFDTWWWPYLFILIAGALATDIWRFLGVLVGGKMREDSQALVLVRCVATALVAGVIAQLIFYPTGELANSPMWLRAGSAILGFGAFLLAGQRILVGVLTGEALLLAGLLIL